MKCNWKEAATVILTAFKETEIKNCWNYKILTLKRSCKSSFMPNGYVFPGGVNASADGNPKWLKLFSEFNLEFNNLDKINGAVPEILKNETGKISKLLSLKITAIRETFEEAGILLCMSKNNSKNSQNWISSNNIYDLELWRSKVQENPSEFLNLCFNFNICPDIGNMHLWSNWLTPISVGKRFDTIFFIASLKEVPDAVADEKEVEKINWSTPENLLQLYNSNKIWLPPPQIYETTRLLNFKDVTALNNFAKIRSAQGCERWMSVKIKTSNGSVSLLPGDDAYPATDYCTPLELTEVNMTNEEFRLGSKVLHRMEFLTKNETKIIVKNYNAPNDHILP